MSTGTNTVLMSAGPAQLRSKAPVFVLGCPRSGTTLVYYMLLSSGTFANYREESNVFIQLMPRFGDLRRRNNRRKLLDLWYQTELFTKTGLRPEQIESRILNECRTAGDFLRIYMDEIVRNQGVERWAETTNEHILLLPLIKGMIPDALILHVIRDGRDAAVSLDKLHWLSRYPWTPEHSLMVHGQYWEWLIRAGREAGRQLGGDYMEIRFEELVTDPHHTLARVGDFIGQNLDYDQIRAAGVRSVKVPNTSFRSDLKQDAGFNPIGRWKSACTPEQLAMLEGLIGSTLTEFGYTLGTPPERLNNSFEVRRMRFLNPRLFSLKKWVRFHTPLMRLSRKIPEDLPSA